MLLRLASLVVCDAGLCHMYSYPIGYIIHTPNWVQRICTQLGAKNVYLMGYMNHVFVVLSRIMLPGILLTIECVERFDTP